MEQLREYLDPVLAMLPEIWSWLISKFVTGASWYQLAAIIVTFALALVASRIFSKQIRRIDNFNMRPAFATQIKRTLTSVSVPFLWVLGMWISALLLGAAGESIVLVRLLASLTNAWVLIRFATIFIPSESWSSVFAWSAWTAAALNALGLTPATITLLESAALNIGKVHLSLWMVLKGGFFTFLLLWGANALSTLIQQRIEKSKSLNPSMRVLIGKVVRVVLLFVAAIFVMQAIGVDITAFAVFSGALGVGIGLGLQRTVANFFAGFTMLADRSIKPGDVIEVTTGDGPTYGTVKTLGTRYVSVLSRSGKETLIPNEMLISNPVVNWSFSDTRIRKGLPIGVSYNADVELAMQLCLDAAKNCPRVLKKPAPNRLITGFGDSSVNLELRFWINDPEDGVANISSLVYLEVWKNFHEHNIEIPFPQRDLHIKSGLEVLNRKDDAAEQT